MFNGIVVNFVIFFCELGYELFLLYTYLKDDIFYRSCTIYNKLIYNNITTTIMS